MSGSHSPRAALVAGALLAMIGAQLVPTAAAAAMCRAQSGAARATLVELYTSEGCSSCPPADRQLSRLTQAGPTVVPLALHVDYWDSIGWKDRFADPAFTDRQRWEVRANHQRTSFTPHFFVNGREVLDWRSDLPASLRSTAPAEARLTVAAEPDAAGPSTTRWRVKVDGRVDGGNHSHGPLQLFVALTESGLRTQVEAGENRGVLLQHEAVSRRFIGPFPVVSGEVSLDRVVELPASAAHVGVVAFIQDASSAEVLQAVETGPCAAG